MKMDMYWAFYDFRSSASSLSAGAMDVFGVRYKVKVGSVGAEILLDIYLSYRKSYRVQRKIILAILPTSEY